MAAGMNPMERRRAPRISQLVHLILSSTSGPIKATTQNISASGVYCTLDQFVAPMTKLEVAFELPTEHKPVRMTVSGVVVRVEPLVTPEGQAQYKIAVFFNALEERDRAIIATFVEQRLSRGAPTS